MYLSCQESSDRQRGATALGLMVLLAVLSIGATVALPLLLDAPRLSRVQLTLERLQAIRTAIVGNPDVQPGRFRHSFGFVGDLGVLPASLDELLAIGSYPAYSSNYDQQLRFGWRGPYLDSTGDGSGTYLALRDAWGTPFSYNSDALECTIVSAGPDTDMASAADNIALEINEDDWHTTVTGNFLDRLRYPLSETELRIYYPDGDSTLAETLITPADANRYDSATDPVSSGSRKIPIGLRCLVARDIQVTQLAVLNGGPLMKVDLIGDQTAQQAVLFRNSFDDPGDLGPAGTSAVLEEVRGDWTVSAGDLSSSWGHVAFGLASWRDYRLEADVTLLPGSLGYGIYYRSNGEYQTTGYLFQFDPGLYSPFGNGIELVIRRVYLGNEEYFPPSGQFLARVRFSRAQFESRFGARIWSDSHHVSITVVGERHIVKLDGSVVIDTSDTEPIFPCGGLCGMAGFKVWNGAAAFHHVVVYAIPPLPNGEIVWWPFEEGNGNRFFGSGFLVDGPEQNGILSGADRLATAGVYGAALRLGSNDYLTLPDHQDLDLAEAGTLSVWINPEQSNQQSGGLIHKGNQASDNDLAYSLVFHASNRLRFYLVNASGTVFLLESIRRLTAADIDRWIHVAVGWNAGGMAIYIDGVLDNQNNLAVTARNSSGPLNLGAQYTFSVHPQQRNYPFLGRIDELRLYRQKLTSAQIGELFRLRAD